ncbi:MAG: carboxypeptidase-like regulatory domain-containing protein, partial [Flavobacteriales bacterium]|nr:carboxypeptidase-like regulatory domain-containing protein [Flavobacteriales bacterium]
MNRKILFTLISLIVCIALHAQNTPTHKISGSIIDSSSREAVPFANISLTQNDSIIAGGISDDNGNFKIAASAGQYTLCISFIGYKNHCEQIVLNQDTHIGVIELGRDATMLSDVVISQSLTTRRGDRLVVNLASSPLVEGKNTRDILNYTPGVHIDNRGTVSINGVQNVRVMINDRDVKMSGDELLSYLESINASDILKIEIIPMAGAEYEADSAGGVIHITLKKKALEGVNATVGMSYTQGIYPVLAPWIKAAWRKDRLSINARYNYNYNQSVNSLEEWTDYLLTGTHHTSTTQVNGKSQSHYATIGAVYDLTSRSELGLAVEYNTSNTNSITTGNTIQEGHSGIMTIPNNFTEHGPYDMVNLTAYYRIKVDTLGSYLKIMADYTSRDRSSS